MEFPRLGQHCSEPTCKQLDFLPMKCDACANIFCRDHVVYATHDCSEAYKKNNQVPECPLCNLPCPTKKGELPDIVIGKHIESYCLSDPAKGRRKVYTNKCSKKGCKKKEMVPVVCETCRLNFCFHHRHKQDHQCKGFQDSGKAVSNAGAAAILRAQQMPKKSQQAVSTSSRIESGNVNTKSDNTRTAIEANYSSMQGAVNEEEALATALHTSMNGSDGGDPDQTDRLIDQEREDFLLAQALAASELEASASRQRRQQSVKA